MHAITSRAASQQDLDAVTEVMTSAFAHDPVWGGWAFPQADPTEREVARRAWWRFNVESALRYPWVRITGSTEAAALWIPPDGHELTDLEEEALPHLLFDLVGDHAGAFLEGLEAFEASHPRGEPHYYLSLLATHDAHRGRGLGIALLAENLARIDVEHLPAYLESTNPANIPRYESLGFTKVGEFTLPAGGPKVDTMWRPASIEDGR